MSIITSPWCHAWGYARNFGSISLAILTFIGNKRINRQSLRLCNLQLNYTNSLAKLDFAINSLEKETNCILSVSKKRLQEEDGIGNTYISCNNYKLENHCHLFLSIRKIKYKNHSLFSGSHWAEAEPGLGLLFWISGLACKCRISRIFNSKFHLAQYMILIVGRGGIVFRLR